MNLKNQFTLFVSSKRPLMTRVVVISSHSLFSKSFSFSSNSASSTCSAEVWILSEPLTVEELLLLLLEVFEAATDVD